MSGRGEWWGQLLDWAGLLAPPLFGAMVYDMRYGDGLTIRQRGTNWLIAAGVGVLGGGFSGEVWNLRPWTTAVIAMGCAFAANDVVTIVRTVLQQFKSDPLGSFRAWWVTLWSRGRQ